MTNTGSLKLAIPEALQPSSGQVLPSLTHETVNELTEAGWSRVGLVVPLVTRAGRLLVLEHNQSDKVGAGMLGPLGETSKASLPVIEQPIETLHRGIREELGVKDPRKLGLRMLQEDGWFTQTWPRGVQYPGEFACAICPPVYVPPITEEMLLARGLGNEEVCGLKALTPDEIAAKPEEQLRPGVTDWLETLEATGFMGWPRERDSRPLDFSRVFTASFVDLDLTLGA